jgi:hypothetical protein
VANSLKLSRGAKATIYGPATFVIRPASACSFMVLLCDPLVQDLARARLSLRIAGQPLPRTRSRRLGHATGHASPAHSREQQPRWVASLHTSLCLRYAVRLEVPVAVRLCVCTAVVACRSCGKEVGRIPDPRGCGLRELESGL